jgi:triphosphatase
MNLLEVPMENEAGIENKPAEQGSLEASKRTVGADRQEIEWQYEPTNGLENIERWLTGRRDGDLENTSGSGIAVGGGFTRVLTDTYYDTKDWRLYHAGYALRIRREGSGGGSEATMKSLTAAGGTAGNLCRRRELSESLEADGANGLATATGSVGERLKVLIGARKVRPIFEVRTRRRIFNLLLGEQPGDAGRSVAAPSDESSSRIVQDTSGDIRLAGGSTRVGEIALDSSEIPLGCGGEVVSFARVEVEANAAAPDITGLEEFVKAMERKLSLRPTAISKYDAGLFATGQSPEGDFDLGSPSVDDSLSVGEAAFAVLRRQFALMRAHEVGSRLGEDPEELHDMGVATRRMRAAIKLFQDALPERARWFRDELKFFAGVMGEVRDLDVQIERLKEWAARIEEEESFEALSRVVIVLDERRSEARVRLLEALDSTRYERFESSFAEMLRRGPTDKALSGPKAPSAGAPILATAPDRLARLYRKWRKAAKRINGSSHPDEHHDLRKKGKRLRYALEFLSDVYGKKATDEVVKPLKKLQDELGAHQDLIVASDLLEELVTTSSKLPSRTAFEMGILAGCQRQEAADLRASLVTSENYRVLVEGKAWKDLEKAMWTQRSKRADKKG